MKSEKYDECDVSQEEVRNQQEKSMIVSLLENFGSFLWSMWDQASSQVIEMDSQVAEDVMNIARNGLNTAIDIQREEEMCRRDRFLNSLKSMTEAPTHIQYAPRNSETGSLFMVSAQLWRDTKNIQNCMNEQDIKHEAEMKEYVEQVKEIAQELPPPRPAPVTPQFVYSNGHWVGPGGVIQDHYDPSNCGGGLGASGGGGDGNGIDRGPSNNCGIEITICLKDGNGNFTDCYNDRDGHHTRP